MYKKLQQGFTIVELLIVVVVIGVLAAIVIVAYNGITASAHESAVQSDLANLAKKLEIYKVQNGVYPSGPTELAAAEVSVTQGSYDIGRNNVYYCRTADLLQYAVGVEAVTDTQYYLVNGSVVDPTPGVNWANTCAKLTPGGNGGATGHDFSGSTGWAAWTS